MRNCIHIDYLNGLEVGQQQVLGLLLAQNILFLLIQPGLHQLQHVSLFTQALSIALRDRMRYVYMPLTVHSGQMQI